MNTKQCYQILGLKTDANLEDIKKAMKELMINHYPYPYNDVEKIRTYNKICSAYRILYSWVLVNESTT